MQWGAAWWQEAEMTVTLIKQRRKHNKIPLYKRLAKLPEIKRCNLVNHSKLNTTQSKYTMSHHQLDSAVETVRSWMAMIHNGSEGRWKSFIRTQSHLYVRQTSTLTLILSQLASLLSNGVASFLNKDLTWNTNKGSYCRMKTKSVLKNIIYDHTCKIISIEKMSISGESWHPIWRPRTH